MHQYCPNICAGNGSYSPIYPHSSFSRIILANIESSYRSISADRKYEYIGTTAHPVFTLEDYRQFHDTHGAHPQLWIGNFGLMALSYYLNTSFWIVNSTEGGMALIDMVPGPLLKLPAVQAPDDLPEVPALRSAHLFLSHSHYQVLLTNALLPGVLSQLLPATEFPCKQCQKVLASGNKFTRHMRTVHKRNDVAPVGTGGLKCVHCPYQTCRRDQLVEHRRIHSKNLPPVACKQCNYTSRQSEDLNNHIRMKHAANSRVADGGFTCNFCGHLSKTVHAMKRHQKHVHADGLQYSCKLCPFTARRPTMLNQHQRHNHGL